MASLPIFKDAPTRAWDEFVCAQGGHLLQSSAWGEFKSRFGWTCSRRALVREHSFLAGAQILYRRLFPGLVLAYAPRGPVWDPLDLDSVQLLLERLVKEARDQGAFMLKIEPDYHLPESGVAPIDALLRASGFRPGEAVQPRTTIHIDLTRNLETILAQMKSKWRYNIRLAERKGVKVRTGTAADIPLFFRLLETTGARDHFPVHSLDYYRTVFELFAARDEVRLWIAEYESEPLAAILVTAFGQEAIYLYGASGNAHRERMPNHALHWAAIRWAKERGCARYDLWGIPDLRRTDDPSLPEGLYQFKQGFGGQVVRYVGGYDYVLSPSRYAVYNAALSLRSRNWT